MRVAFRCDASTAIGSGHVMRCVNLARVLLQRGVEVQFLCRKFPGDLIDSLTREFRVCCLPKLASDAPIIVDLEGRNLYASWLGCSQHQDVDDCLIALNDSRTGLIDWLVVDHYSLDHIWERRMSTLLYELHGQRPKILVFDDLADRPHQTELLVDANRCGVGSFQAYQNLVPSSCRLLLGPAYAPVDPTYGQLHPLSPRRCTIKRLMIFFGGVDKTNHTAIALEALNHPDLSDIEVDVILSKNAPHYTHVAKLVRQRSHTQLHSGLPSLVGLMLRADLAIGGAGFASWERAALALPSLVIPVAENQRQGAHALVKAGAALLINPTELLQIPLFLVDSIKCLITHPNRLQNLSACAHALGDGRGLHRILTAMLGPSNGLRLRPARLDDETMYYVWVNDPEVRKQSFTSEPVHLDQHQSWFRTRLQSDTALLRVFINQDGLPLGQIRFERCQDMPSRSIISFSLDPVARGYGLSAQLLLLGSAELRRQWSDCVEAYGEVRADNHASCSAFLRAGFLEGIAPRQGVRCFKNVYHPVT